MPETIHCFRPDGSRWVPFTGREIGDEVRRKGRLMDTQFNIVDLCYDRTCEIGEQRRTEQGQGRNSLSL